MSIESDKINLNPKVVDFLAQPYLARLATADPESGQPHVVPVWFEWDGQGVWISSFRSTRKVRELRRNPRYSLVVDTDSRGEEARGVLFEGRAHIFDDAQMGPERGFHIYARYLGEEGARKDEPQSWLHDPEHLLLYLEVDKVKVWGI